MGTGNWSNVMFQLREFHDGSWSVIARIHNPCKQFYEHPTHINLTKDKAQEYCQQLIENPVPLGEILAAWEYIGD